MAGSPDIGLRIRPLEELAAAEDRLSPLAKVHHAHSLGPQRIALPPMPIGETFLTRWPVHEGPGTVTHRADHYMSVAPALFVLRDAIVHSSAGLIGVGGAAIAETLLHTDPGAQSFQRTADSVSLHIRTLRHLSGTHVTVLGGACGNYFHALLEGVLRLALMPPHWLCQARSMLYSGDGACQAQVLARMGLPQSLDLTPVGDGETLVVERLLYPLSVYGLAAYHPCLGALFGRIAAEVPKGAVLPKRFYVDRRGAWRRRLLNEDEVIAALRPLGIVAVRPETMPFDDQARLFHGAEMIVAPHGAALTNLGFCEPECRVLELQMDGYANWLFRRLAALRGLNYDCVFGRAVGGLPDSRADVHGLGWIVSAQHVAAAVGRMSD